jgi:hypothetical protein
MRLKPDGTLDGLDHWKEPDSSNRWMTQEEKDERLLNSILCNHPSLTRERAQKMLDLFGITLPAGHRFRLTIASAR